MDIPEHDSHMPVTGAGKTTVEAALIAQCLEQGFAGGIDPNTPRGGAMASAFRWEGINVMAGGSSAAFAPYLTGDAVTVYGGDCIELLRADELGYDWSLGYGSRRLFPDASIDSVITDPPYGLGFMGKEWDSGRSFFERKPARRNTFDHIGGNHNPTHAGVASRTRRVEAQRFGEWCQQWATECLRVLKPGGYLIAFGGTRTWHRLASAVEDGGFEVRDSVAWLYGSGFPKSLDVSKAIDKAAGAERDVIASGAPVKRMIPGADQNRTGSWIKDNGREYVPAQTAPATAEAVRWQGWGTALKPAFEPIVVARKPLAGTVSQNVRAHGTGALNIDGCRIASAGGVDPSIARREGPANRPQRRSAADSERVGRIESHTSQERCSEPREGVEIGRWPTNVVIDETQAAELDCQTGILRSGANPTRRGSDIFRNVYGDFTGQPECVPHRGADEGGASRFFPTFRYQAKADAAERPTVDGVAHPTVKPLELMRWLVRLVTPPHGIVLDPFAGSGTTAEACIHEHMDCIAIEREPDYLPLITQRLTKPMEVGFDFGEAS